MQNLVLKDILRPKRGKIAKSRFAEDIVSMILSGWSSYEIAKWLDARGEHINSASIRKWSKKRIPAKYVLNRPLLKAKTQDFEVKINELKALQNLILIQEERVQKSLKTEEKSPFPLPYTSKEMHFLSELYLKGLRLKQELGLIDKVPEKLEVSGEFKISLKKALELIRTYKLQAEKKIVVEGKNAE